MTAFVWGAAPTQAAIDLRTVASGLSSPVYVTSARDGTGRLFIVEQAGRIRILAGGILRSSPFLDIRDRVRSGGEMGLLGLAFHPNYRTNGRFFVNYTRDGPEGLETVIAEYSITSAGPTASRIIEKILLRFRQPFENHNGGMIEFGPDSFLYIATGDGGSGGDPQGNGQNLNTLLGKILRIDVDGGDPYAIPPDNPFIGRGRGEIWAYGLRNPWRFSFDRLTGRIFAADVGQNRREEIDLITRGGNYGWNIMEGNLCFAPQTNCNQSGLILPLHDYGRDLGISVTGGYVYRGRNVPSLTGQYLFGDYGSGRIWALAELSDGRWQVEQLLDTNLNISSFGEDDNGEIYVVHHGGSVHQVVSLGSPAAGPAINPGGVVNAASFLPDAVAPGKIVSIFGTGLGPDQAAGAQLDSSGKLATLVADARVLFDGVAAPLFYVQANQVTAQAPYSIVGRSVTQIQVEYRGVLSQAVHIPVTDAAPGIFVVSGGSGAAAALNQDGSTNSPANSAPPGSIISLFATGEGQTAPGGIEGKLAEVPYPTPLLPVTVTIGGLPAEVLFVGSAPGYAGLMQINIRIPVISAFQSALPVLIQIGRVQTQPGVTVSVAAFLGGQLGDAPAVPK